MTKLGYRKREVHMLEYIRQGKFTTVAEYAREVGIRREAAYVVFQRLLYKGKIKKLLIVVEDENEK